MSIHARKAMVECIESPKDIEGFPTLDWYEKRLIECAEELDDSSVISLIKFSAKLQVHATHLLEIARRKDPSYGLTPISYHEELAKASGVCDE